MWESFFAKIDLMSITIPFSFLEKTAIRNQVCNNESNKKLSMSQTVFVT